MQLEAENAENRAADRRKAAGASLLAPRTGAIPSGDSQSKYGAVLAGPCGTRVPLPTMPLRPHNLHTRP